MEETVQLGFESFPSQIPGLTGRFLILPPANTRQRHMHIYSNGKATFEEAMATVQPPQLQ